VTPAQRWILNVVGELERELGYGPSTREIAARAGYASTSTVHYHLMRLMDEGAITRAARHAGYTTVRGPVECGTSTHG
jgi:repressor LexA